MKYNRDELEQVRYIRNDHAADTMSCPCWSMTLEDILEDWLWIHVQIFSETDKFAAEHQEEDVALS